MGGLCSHADGERQVALRAVADASPLPPLPSGLAGASLPASFRFWLFPE